jgi:hypothetical protein
MVRYRQSSVDCLCCQQQQQLGGKEGRDLKPQADLQRKGSESRTQFRATKHCKKTTTESQSFCKNEEMNDNVFVSFSPSCRISTGPVYIYKAYNIIFITHIGWTIKLVGWGPIKKTFLMIAEI